MTTHAANVAAQIAQLPTLPMENLWALWDEFSTGAPVIITAPTWRRALPTNCRSAPTVHCPPLFAGG